MYNVSSLKWGNLKCTFGRKLGYNEQTRTFKTEQGAMNYMEKILIEGHLQITLFDDNAPDVFYDYTDNGLRSIPLLKGETSK